MADMRGAEICLKPVDWRDYDIAKKQFSRSWIRERKEELDQALKQNKKWEEELADDWKRERVEYISRIKKPLLVNVDLRGADLTGAFLAGLDLANVRLEGSVIEGACMEGVVLCGAHLDNTSIYWSRLEGANFEQAHLEGAFFGYDQMATANLTDAHMEMARLIDCNAESAKFRDAHLNGAYFSNVNFEKADFRKANLKEASLSICKLAGAVFSNGDSDDSPAFTDANLYKVNFDGAHVTFASMSGIQYEHAQFVDAELNYGTFVGAYLNYAHFEGAKLYGAHFEGASLRNASFEGADLRDAHFEGADLSNASFRGALLGSTRENIFRLTLAELDNRKTGESEHEANVYVRAHFEGAIIAGATLCETVGIEWDRDAFQRMFCESVGDNDTVFPSGVETVFCLIPDKDGRLVLEISDSAIRPKTWDDPKYLDRVFYPLDVLVE